MSRRRIRRAVGTMMPLGEDVLDRKQDLESTECSRHLLRSRRSIAITLTFTEDGRMYAYLLTFVPNVVALSARLRRSQFGILMKPTSMSNGAQGKAEYLRQRPRFIEKLLQIHYRARFRGSRSPNSQQTVYIGPNIAACGKSGLTPRISSPE
jgi:hypothetical protein